MSERSDFPLPISDPSGADAWRVEQQTTTLIALWTGDRPTLTEVVAALEQEFDAPLRREDEGDCPGDVIWSAMITVPLREGMALLWAEPAKPLEPDELDDPAAHGARWAIGVEVLLSRDDPFEEYMRVLRAVARGLAPAAVLDVITGRWHTRRELDGWCSTGPPGPPVDEPVDPPVEILWAVHAVGPNAEDADDVAPISPDAHGPLWLHTHGLWRCGRPELEMLEVPAERAQIAAGLLNDLAEAALDEGLPPPGETHEIGPGIAVVFQPWQEVAPHVQPPARGGLRDREAINDAADGSSHDSSREGILEGPHDNPHAGMRAVVCAPHRKGVFRRLWVWPEHAVEALERDATTVFKSPRATERRAKMARASWPELAMAVASLPGELARPRDERRFIVLIKAGFPASDDTVEHLWFEIRGVRGDAATGELINQPRDVPSMQHGDTITITRAQVSDWLALTPLGRYGPERTHELRELAAKLRATK